MQKVKTLDLDHRNGMHGAKPSLKLISQLNKKKGLLSPYT